MKCQENNFKHQMKISFWNFSEPTMEGHRRIIRNKIRKKYYKSKLWSEEELTVYFKKCTSSSYNMNITKNANIQKVLLSKAGFY